MCCPVSEASPGGTSLLEQGAQRRTSGSPEPQFYADEDHVPPPAAEPPPPKKDPPGQEPPPEADPPQDPPPEADPPQEPPPEGEPGEGGGTEGAFQGDFTYVVKGQQRTMPDWAKAAVTDENSNRAVREIFEKAEGFDFVKNDRDALQQWYDEVQPTLQNVQMLNQLVQKGDLGAFFQGAGIPLQNVLNWSLQYAQMDPNQRANMLSQSQQTFDQFNTQIQSQNQLNGFQQQLVQAREREVNLLLSRPDVQQISQQLDQRFGKFGVLREEIINRGKYYGAQGQDKPAEELLNEIMSFTGLQLGGQPAGIPLPNSNPQGGGGQPSPAGTGPVPQNRGTMTNLRGSGRSPARKVIKNREDLRERASQLEAQGR